MKILVIARVAHEINRAYCAALGDTSQPAWEDAPEWQQKSAIAGVEMHLANPDATPEQSHESWLAQKLADGWVYGELKDAEAKTHPCCLPYAELPAEQKAKDYLFRGAVHALKGIADADEAVAAALAAAATTGSGQVQAPVSGVLVTYIGRREQWRDTVYDTGLEFVAGQTRDVPPAVAQLLLRHPDVFARAGEGAAVASPVETQAQLAQKDVAQQKRNEESREFAVIDQVNTMDKNTLAEYALNHFQLKLNRTKKVETLRQEVADHITRYGVV